MLFSNFMEEDNEENNKTDLKDKIYFEEEIDQ